MTSRCRKIETEGDLVVAVCTTRSCCTVSPTSHTPYVPRVVVASLRWSVRSVAHRCL